MAIYRKGPITGAISGSIAAVTFAETRAGGVLRSRQRANSGKSKRQTNRAAAFSSLATGWHSLTTLQRTSWNAAASNLFWTSSLGRKYHPTGYLLFSQIHIRALHIAPHTFTEPPGLSRTPPLNITSFDVDASRAVFSVFYPNPGGVDGSLWWYISHPNTVAPLTFTKDWKFLQVTDYTGTQANLIGEYERRYGPLRTGETIGLRWVTWLHDQLPTAPRTQIFTA